MTICTGVRRRTPGAHPRLVKFSCMQRETVASHCPAHSAGLCAPSSGAGARDAYPGRVFGKFLALCQVAGPARCELAGHGRVASRVKRLEVSLIEATTAKIIASGLRPIAEPRWGYKWTCSRTHSSAPRSCTASRPEPAAGSDAGCATRRFAKRDAAKRPRCTGFVIDGLRTLLMLACHADNRFA